MISHFIQEIFTLGSSSALFFSVERECFPLNQVNKCKLFLNSSLWIIYIHNSFWVDIARIVRIAHITHCKQHSAHVALYL